MCLVACSEEENKSVDVVPTEACSGGNVTIVRDGNSVCEPKATCTVYKETYQEATNTCACDASGNWKGTAPNCYCDTASGDYVLLNDGNTCAPKKTCESNKEAYDSATNSCACDASGNWKGTAPNCYCDTASGNYVLLNNENTCALKKTCESNMEAYESATNSCVCDASGNWKGTAPNCYCDTASGDYVLLNNGNTCAPKKTCESNKEIYDPATNSCTCDASSNWKGTAPNCYCDTASGNYVLLNDGNTCALKKACDSDKEAYDPTTNSCACDASGNWKGTAPNCYCETEGGNYALSSDGKTCSRNSTCDPDRETYLSDHCECNTAGNWFGTSPNCTCGDGSDSYVTKEKNGSTVCEPKATCDRVSQKYDEDTNTCACDIEHNWTGTSPNCYCDTASGNYVLLNNENTCALKKTCESNKEIYDPATNSCACDASSNWKGNSPNCYCDTDSGNYVLLNDGNTCATKKICDPNTEKYDPATNTCACNASGNWKGSSPNCYCDTDSGNYVLSSDGKTCSRKSICDPDKEINQSNQCVCNTARNWFGTSPNCSCGDGSDSYVSIEKNGSPVCEHRATCDKQGQKYVEDTNSCVCDTSGNWMGTSPNCYCDTASGNYVLLNNGNTCAIKKTCESNRETYDPATNTCVCDTASNWKGSSPTCYCDTASGNYVLLNNDNTCALKKTCNSNKETYDPATNTCVCDASGNWTGSSPSCYCDTESDNYVLSSDGKTCSRKSICDPVREINQSNVCVCNAEGNWKGTSPNCYCDTGSGYVLLNGNTCEVKKTCDPIMENYDLATNTCACDASGNWKGTSPSCYCDTASGDYVLLNNGNTCAPKKVCDPNKENYIPDTNTCACDAAGNWKGNSPYCYCNTDSGNYVLLNDGNTCEIKKTCEPNKEIYDPATNTCACNASGNWKGNSPSCYCDTASGDYVLLNDGNTCAMKNSCDPNKETYNPATNTCECSGNWKGTSPNCYCDIDSGNYVLLNGNACEIKKTCDPNKESYVSATNTCECSGNWKGNSPNCYCDTDSGNYVLLNGTTCEMKKTCDPNKETYDPATNTCKCSGNWQGTSPYCRCNIASGNYVLLNNGTTCEKRKTCDPDKETYDSDTNTCACNASGNWQGTAPDCYCDTESGNYVLFENTNTCEIKQHCDPYKETYLEALNYCMCDSSRNWTGTSPRCHCNTASGNYVLMNDGHTCAKIATCDPNKETYDPDTNTCACNASGNWQGSSPDCYCDTAHGYVLLNDGTTCEMKKTCDPIMETYDPNTNTCACNASGNWFGTAPDCSCGDGSDAYMTIERDGNTVCERRATCDQEGQMYDEDTNSCVCDEAYGWTGNGVTCTCTQGAPCSCPGAFYQDRCVVVGSFVTFGKYPQTSDEPSSLQDLEWRILEIDRANRKMLLLTKHVINAMKFHGEGSNYPTWAKSDIRTWLNGTEYPQFLSSFYFSAQDQNRIVEVTNSTSDNKNEVSGHHIIDGGVDTQDKVFLLDVKNAANEAYFASYPARKAFATTYAIAQGVDVTKPSGVSVCGNVECTAEWWLRTPGTSQYDALSVEDDGEISLFGREINKAWVGVRPALWIKY